MSSNSLIRQCQSDADRAAAMRIRFAVFVDEQQVLPELELDEYDAEAIHLLVLDSATGEAIGTARIVDKGNGVAKIGRVAILKEWRGRGIGDALMRAALEIARAAGHTSAILDAQTYVIPFYEKLGFIAEGPEFDDAGIPHRRMRRHLN
jgi:predicted GNAT family N-acyltransferase